MADKDIRPAVLISAAILMQSGTVFAATAQRTFVATTGNDANACTLAAPCRTFGRAITQTTAGGEVIVIDSGAYGTVNITKAVSITAPAGVYAGISVFVGIGIAVSVGASDAVNLTGLTLNGLGGSDGIVFNTGGALTIDRCVVRGFTGPGIHLQPGATAKFVIRDTVVSTNGGDGIFVQSTASGVHGVISNVLVERNQFGIEITGVGNAGSLDFVLENSTVANNAQDGILADTEAGGTPARLTVINSTSIGNGLGLDAVGSNALIRMTGVTITGNASGWQVFQNGTVQSYGDNNIDGNTSNEATPPQIFHK
jgi:Right handed beta helix region